MGSGTGGRAGLLLPVETERVLCFDAQGHWVAFGIKPRTAARAGLIASLGAVEGVQEAPNQTALRAARRRATKPMAPRPASISA